MTLRGTLAAFPLETLLQLLAATGKTGELVLRGAGEEGRLGMASGRLVSARWDGEDGELALAAALASRDGEFDFQEWHDPPAGNLSGELDELLDRAVGVRDRLVALRALVPSDRARFRLSERAAQQPQITLTSDQWRALLAADGGRDVRAIAAHLGVGRLPATILMAELIEGGLVDVEGGEAEPAEAEPAGAEEPPAEPEPPAASTEAAPEHSLAQSAIDAPVASDERLAAMSGIFAPAPLVPPQPVREVPPAAEPEEDLRTVALRERPAPAEEPLPDPRMAAVEEPEPEWRTAALEAERAPQPEPEWRTKALEAERAQEARMAALQVEPEAEIAEPGVEAKWSAPPPTEPVESMLRQRAAPPPQKKGLFGLFAGRPAPAPAVALPDSWTGQLATFANELLAEYNSGRYGKARLAEPMSELIMRVDEQADPIDRAVPLADGGIDVPALELHGTTEAQAVPYLAAVVRQIYDDAERAFGRDRARRGYREVRQRMFGKEPAPLQAPQVAARLPRV